jgi:hypothetical protein
MEGGGVVVYWMGLLQVEIGQVKSPVLADRDMLRCQPFEGLTNGE